MFSEREDYVVGSVEDVQAAVKDCSGSDFGLTAVGGGTQTHVGHTSTRNLRRIGTNNLDKVVDYNPDDLVIVAEAGMTFSSLQRALRSHGQWLPLEVPAPEQQTIGGLVATRANSLLRAGYGSIRDWLIGVEVVNSAGDVVVGGGKVVKNVAGYDLPKLYCGSWGTLGVLTKVNFKVAALPEADRSLLIVLSANRNSEELIDHLLATTSPTSTLLLNSNAAKRLLGEDAAEAQYLVVRYVGNQEEVDEGINRCAELAQSFASSVIALPDAVGAKLTAQIVTFFSSDAPLVARYHILSSQVGAYARMVEWIAKRGGLVADVVADVSCGIVTAWFRPAGDNVNWSTFLPLFRDKANRVGGSLIIERMPDLWRAANVDVWSPILPDHRIMRAIKQSLDPNNLFNPGRFMGGI